MTDGLETLVENDQSSKVKPISAMIGGATAFPIISYLVDGKIGSGSPGMLAGCFLGGFLVDLTAYYFKSKKVRDLSTTLAEASCMFTGAVIAGYILNYYIGMN